MGQKNRDTILFYMKKIVLLPLTRHSIGKNDRYKRQIQTILGVETAAPPGGSALGRSA